VERFRQLAAGARRWAGRALRSAGWVTRSDVNRLAAESAELGQRVAALSELAPQIGWLLTRTDALEERERLHVHAIEQLKNLAAIEAFSRFIRYATLTTGPLVSVVTPTTRPDRLKRAIESVRAQRYDNWELLVVGDAGRADTRAVADALGDQRISYLESARPNESAARNQGLEHARGELIAYLDDDNLMDPGWLHAVVWAFEQRPDVDTLYGALVADDELRFAGKSSGGHPVIWFHPWSRDSLRQSNIADMSSMAHRAGLPEAWLDERLEGVVDWDLLLRLTADKDPLALPAIACYYTTGAPDRISDRSSSADAAAVVRARERGATRV
jgi:hypothetical protein